MFFTRLINPLYFQIQIAGNDTQVKCSDCILCPVTQKAPEAEEHEGAGDQLLFPSVVDGRSITVQVIQVHENREGI